MDRARVLIIDHDPGWQELVAGALTDCEIVGVAEDYRSGLSLLSSQEADLVLVDLVLPGGDGIEMIHEAHARGVQIPFIVATASRDLDLARRALRAGAQGYIAKSSTAEQLRGAVGETLDHPA